MTQLKLKSPFPVIFAGAGPGDVELITVKAMRALEQADVVLYAGSLIPLDMLSYTQKTCICINTAPMNLEETHQSIKNFSAENKKIVRLHTGDPSIFGAIREQIHLLEQDKIPYQIIPGVTVAFATAAKAGISFTIPELTQSLIITRIGGRTSVSENENFARHARQGCAMAIYLSIHDAKYIETTLLNTGYAPQTKIVIGYKVGWAGEKIITTNLENLLNTVLAENLKKQTTILVLPHQTSKTTSKLYSPDFEHEFRTNKQSK